MWCGNNYVTPWAVELWHEYVLLLTIYNNNNNNIITIINKLNFSELLGSWTLSIVWNSKCKKTQRFRNWIFRCLGQWLRLALSKGANRVGVSLPSPEDGNRSSFRNVVFPSIYNSGRRTKSRNPVNPNETPSVYTKYFRLITLISTKGH
jgi:hypothetical protein